jgi:hypothetical protein
MSPIIIVRPPLSKCVAVCANCSQSTSRHGRYSQPPARALPHDMLSSVSQRFLAAMLHLMTQIRNRVLETRPMHSSHVGSCRSDKSASLSARGPYPGTTILYNIILLSSRHSSAHAPFSVLLLPFLSSVCFIVRSFLMILNKSLK